MPLGLTDLPSEWVQWIKQPRREAGHSPPFIAEVKNGEVILPPPPPINIHDLALN
jgi:hypothetical protein